MVKRLTALLKLLMAKLLTQDLTYLPSALFGRREKHLERSFSFTGTLDRLTKWGREILVYIAITEPNKSFQTRSH